MNAIVESEAPAPAADDEQAWRCRRKQWSIRDDTTYLNHGSFGPPPKAVRESQLAWQQQLASQPMDFFYRRYEPAWLAARQRLANFVGACPDHLAFVENATAAMNVVANSFPLEHDDQVLLTDHEYGAVVRIWPRACQQAGAAEPRIASLPAKLESVDHVVDAIFNAATERTRLLVVSHVTSPTAVILPIEKICREARRRGIAICVDGPHAPRKSRCLWTDYRATSTRPACTSGFRRRLARGSSSLAPSWLDRVKTPLLSWGRLAPERPTAWWHEFLWVGTRDPSPYFASTAAIDLLERVGLPAFRARTHHLAAYARQQLTELTGLAPATPDSEQWYGAMASCPLPPGDAVGLQQTLWREHGIEVPIVHHNGQRSIRVSCHLYNSRDDIDLLVQCLRPLLRQGGYRRSRALVGAHVPVGADDAAEIRREELAQVRSRQGDRQAAGIGAVRAIGQGRPARVAVGLAFAEFATSRSARKEVAIVAVSALALRPHHLNAQLPVPAWNRMLFCITNRSPIVLNTFVSSLRQKKLLFWTTTSASELRTRRFWR